MPRWLSKELRRAFKNALFAQKPFSQDSTFKTSRKISQRLTLDAPVVCKRCNNGWMSQLEDATKDVLLPLVTKPHKPVTLSDEDCLILASWMTLKTMVLDCHSTAEGIQRHRFFTPRQRYAFKRNAVPPRSVFVWIGRFDPHRPPSGNVRAVFFYQFKRQDFANLTAYICTFKLGEPTIQLITLRPRMRGTRVPRYLKFFYVPTRSDWATLMPMLWPRLPRAIAWPPPGTLGQNDRFDFVHYRLSGIPTASH